jgi:hypothetical protein
VAGVELELFRGADFANGRLYHSREVNRTGFIGGPIAREDGAHGTTKQVLARAA